MADVGVLLALAAGAAAFLSPCILPVIPSYLTMVSGIGYRNLAAGDYSRRAILIGSLAFVLGFTAVFVVMGIIVSSTVFLLGGFTRIVNGIAGGIAIFFGLNAVFDFVRVFNVEKRFHLKTARRGFGSSLLLGAAFGAGWTPCIGPVLSTVLIMAGSAGEAGRGAVLLTAFSLGLGLPFILIGLFFTRSQGAMTALKRHFGILKRLGGGVMILIGVLIFNGALLRFNGTLFSWAYLLESWSTEHPAAARWAATVPVILAALPAAWVMIRRREAAKRIAAGAVSALLLLSAGGIILGILNPYGWFSSWLMFTGL